MTDYSKLVEALRFCFSQSGHGCGWCPYKDHKKPCDAGLLAAAAIEELQATIELMKPFMPDFFPDANKVVLPKLEPKRGEWVRVEDKLPNDGDWAIFTNGKVVTVERFKEDAYNHFFPASEWFDFEDAIAWMPLPEPPKEET